MKPLTYSLIGVCCLLAPFFTIIAIVALTQGHAGYGIFNLVIAAIWLVNGRINVATLRSIRVQEADQKRWAAEDAAIRARWSQALGD